MQPICNFYSVKRCCLKIKHRVKDFDHMSPGSRRLTCSKLTMETPIIVNVKHFFVSFSCASIVDFEQVNVRAR